MMKYVLSFLSTSSFTNRCGDECSSAARRSKKGKTTMYDVVVKGRKNNYSLLQSYNHIIIIITTVLWKDNVYNN